MVNLFEKYGIKDVADVTIYRIEKKEETYESQRKVNIASILKGAVELKTVYPFKDGKGDEDGFQAYVFTNAEVNTGANYDCDDDAVHTVTKTITGSFKVDGIAGATDQDPYTLPAITNKTVDKENLEESDITVTGASNYTLDPDEAVISNPDEVDLTNVTFGSWEITYELPATIEEQDNVINFTAVATTTVVDNTGVDIDTGAYSHAPSSAGTVVGKDPDKFPGTHEYSYADQAFMLFAKRQNLISTTGTRYVFNNTAELMGNLIFEDAYALAPNSSERVVVLGIGTASNDRDEATWTDADYDIAEVNEALSNLTGSFNAKAYDVVYGSYAELVVEDEMGYFNPKFLGTGYDKTAGKVTGNYTALASKDTVLATAQMWGEGIHFSINDAIDALRQAQKEIDADSTSAEGIGGIYGGYRVASTLNAGESDLGTYANYTFYKAGTNSASNLGTSEYSLAKVMDKLTELAYAENVSGSVIGVDYADVDKTSNRAIYVNFSGANVAASSYVYLLHNKNYRKLASDIEGVFTFADKNGNKVYYQDKIFAKTEWLAIVVVGKKGFVFVVNRNGNKDVTKIAWMVSDGDFVSDKSAQSLVTNGLIHTTTITVNNETFEATCAVKKLSIRKTKKIANRYIPVLFLDTLQVSTIEQTAEEVYATGGRGNSNLIGWDFGKAITLNITDALFTPASMSAMLGSYDNDDFKSGVKETKSLDRMEKCIAPRSFIVPAGNQNGVPSEADKTAQAVYIDPNTMEPYADGTPIAEGETYLKWARSIAYEGQSLGNTIEISAEKFPGTYKIVGETFIKSKSTGKDERFQFVVPQAKFQTEQTITLEASGDPSVFSMNMTVLKPDDGVMMRLVQYDVVENKAENDGSTMVKNTENLNLLDDAELYRVDTVTADEEDFIGATEY